MRTTAKRASVLAGFLAFAAVVTSPSPASAAVALCNGRCLVIDRPVCSLSLFGQVICFEGVDYCAEFACPYSASLPSQPLGQPSLQAAPLLQCALSPEVSFPRLPGGIQVTYLKARS